MRIDDFSLNQYEREYLFSATVRLKNKEIISAGHKGEIITTSVIRNNNEAFSV